LSTFFPLIHSSFRPSILLLLHPSVYWSFSPSIHPSVLPSSRLTSAPVSALWIGGWVNPRAEMDAVERGVTPISPMRRTPVSPVIKTVAESLYSLKYPIPFQDRQIEVL
jgi:hypothetical protein